MAYAMKQAERGNTLLAAGHAARAALEEAHARCCAERRWVLNEKHLLRVAGLLDVADLLLVDGADQAGVGRSLESLRGRLERYEPAAG